MAFSLIELVCIRGFHCPRVCDQTIPIAASGQSEIGIGNIEMHRMFDDVVPFRKADGEAVRSGGELADVKAKFAGFAGGLDRAFHREHTRRLPDSGLPRRS